MSPVARRAEPPQEKAVMPVRKEDDSPNPDFNRPHPPEHPAVAKARLFQWHFARGSMGIYYDLYPEDRVPKPEPKPAPPRGRSR
jgi:hypothetical protein